MTQPTCETCAHFARSNQYVIGRIKFDGACIIRSTPATVIQIRRWLWSKQRTYHLPFPARDDTDGCGEHTPKEQAND